MSIRSEQMVSKCCQLQVEEVYECQRSAREASSDDPVSDALYERDLNLHLTIETFILTRSDIHLLERQYIGREAPRHISSEIMAQGNASNNAFKVPYSCCLAYEMC